MTLKNFSISLLCLLAAASANAQEPAKEATDSSIAKTLLDSSVVIQYRFKFDDGDDPAMPESWGAGINNLAERAASRKPLEMPGYLLSNGEIMTPDILIPSRFVKSISALKNGVSLPAKPAGENLEKGALFLKAEGELDATPLKFQAKSEAEPAKSANLWLDGAAWRVIVKKLAPEYVEFPESKETVLRGPTQSLILAADGAALGFLMRDGDMDGEWRGDPASWSKDDPGKLEAMREAAKRKVEASACLVKLSFKLPPQGPGSQFALPQPRQAAQGSPDSSTEVFAAGFPLESRRMIVLTDLGPDKLALLDSVRISGADGAGEFEGSCSAVLRDFAALVVEPKAPDKTFKTPELTPERNLILMRKLPLFFMIGEIYPDKIELAAFPGRAVALEKGFMNIVSLRFPFNFGGSYDKVKSFKLASDFEGRLIAIQAEPRKRPRFDSYSYQPLSSNAPLLPVKDLQGIVSDSSKAIAFAQVPEEQRREPWFGADVQKMSLELARASNACKSARNGRIGAIVSNVNAGSPAGKAGLRQGDILLRVCFDGDASPIDVELQDAFSGGYEYPWAQLDSMPDSMLQRLPPPWGVAVNPMNKFLAQAIPGRKYSVEILRDGNVLEIPGLAVEFGPEDFATAAKFKMESVGLTVKSLTYEARRYLKLPADAPGVVVCKLDPGGKAAVAGLKPYEIIVSIDGQPVKSVKDFEELSAGKDELKLIVQRLGAERSVRVTGISQKQP